MIIGQFCDVFPPETDGVGTVVKNYVQELNTKGHQCYYISPVNPSYRGENSLPLIQFKSLRLSKGNYRAGLAFFDLNFRRAMKNLDFDVLHAHSPFSAGRIAVNIAKKRKIPLVGTFHSKYYDDFYKVTHSRLISHTGVKIIIDFYNNCDEVWTVNNATADVLKNYGYQGTIKIMPNGTNFWNHTPDLISLAPDKFNFRNSTVLLFVGQQDWKKNIRHIIEAVKIFSTKNKDFKFVFAGKGPDEEKIKELVVELGLNDNFIFTGHISNRDVLMSLYARADLFVFPSLYDNAPMVVREAASAGTASILVQNSCASEGVTHRYNGFLCEDTPESIAKCISESLPLSKQAGINAKNTIPIEWSDIIDKAVHQYEDIIANKACLLKE